MIPAKISPTSPGSNSRVASPTDSSIRCTPGSVVVMHLGAIQIPAVLRHPAGRRLVAVRGDREQQVHHRGLRGVRNDGHARCPGQHRRERPGMVQIGGEPRQPLAQAGQGRRRTRPQAVQRAAHPPPPLPHLADDLGRTGDAAAGQRADALVEGHVDGVEQGGYVTGRPPVAGSRLPQPRPVQVRRRASLVRPRDLGPQVIEDRLLAADIALWQLDQQRRRGLADRAEVRQRQQPVQIPDRPAVSPCRRW